MSPAVQAVVAAIIVGGAVVYAIRGAVRSARGRKPGCCQVGAASGAGSGSGCSGCSGCPGRTGCGK